MMFRVRVMMMVVVVVLMMRIRARSFRKFPKRTHTHRERSCDATPALVEERLDHVQFTFSEKMMFVNALLLLLVFGGIVSSTDGTTRCQACTQAGLTSG